MPGRDFTLKKIKEQLGIKVVEDQDLFASVREIPISEYLLTTLKYNVPLALAVGTEKMVILDLLHKSSVSNC